MSINDNNNIDPRELFRSLQNVKANCANTTSCRDCRMTLRNGKCPISEPYKWKLSFFVDEKKRAKILIEVDEE